MKQETMSVPPTVGNTFDRLTPGQAEGMILHALAFAEPPLWLLDLIAIASRKIEQTPDHRLEWLYRAAGDYDRGTQAYRDVAVAIIVATLKREPRPISRTSGAWSTILADALCLCEGHINNMALSGRRELVRVGVDQKIVDMMKGRAGNPKRGGSR